MYRLVLLAVGSAIAMFIAAQVLLSGRAAASGDGNGKAAVHALAVDLVALGHLLGGLQHVPVDLGLVLHQPGIGHHVGVHFLLHARDAFNTTGHVDVALARNDALRGQRDGLQAGRAEAVDCHARGGNGQAGAQSGLAGDVGAGGAFGVGAAHDDVVDFGALNAGALDGMFDRVATQCGAMGHVERALPALGERGAGGGNDNGGCHDELLKI